jgi:Family of unknown function (DUF5678)
LHLRRKIRAKDNHRLTGEADSGMIDFLPQYNTKEGTGEIVIGNKFNNTPMKKTTTPIFDVEKYAGKQVAIVDGKIIAAGTDPAEVIEAATREVPHITPQDISLISIPPSPRVIYY